MLKRNFICTCNLFSLLVNFHKFVNYSVYYIDASLNTCNYYFHVSASNRINYRKNRCDKIMRANELEINYCRQIYLSTIVICRA